MTMFEVTPPFPELMKESTLGGNPQKIGAWVAKALAAERAAINQQLVKYHETLLARLDTDLQAFDSFSQMSTPAYVPANESSQPLLSVAEIDLDLSAGKLNLPRSKVAAVNVSPSRVEPNLVGNGQQLSAELFDNEEEIEEELKELEEKVEELADNKEWDPRIQILDDEDIPEDKPDAPVRGASHESSLSHLRDEVHEKGVFGAIVDSEWFEAFFVTLVLVNTVTSALQAQYRGFGVAYLLKYEAVTSNNYRIDTSAEDIWPGAGDTFETLEIIFAALYTIELLLKFGGLRCSFFKSGWNMFDLFIMCTWYVTELTNAGDAFNPMILRVARLARLMRLVKHVGWFQTFDSLHMLISAIKSSFSVLIWSTLILAMLLIVVSLVLSGFLVDYLEDPGRPAAQRIQVYKYFGTFTRSLVTMFEVTFASHVPVTRTVMENVDESYSLIFLIYKVVVGLSIMKVITGVFLHETFKVCSEDDELMIIQRKRTQADHKAKMERLFDQIDESGDGLLSLDEFKKCMTDEWVRTWLSAMDLDTNHVDRLWKMVDDGDGTITAAELVKGVAKLKGAAKSMDMNHTVREIGDLKAVTNGILHTVGKMNSNLLIVAGRIEASGYGYTDPKGPSPWLDPAALLKYDDDPGGASQLQWQSLNKEYSNVTMESF